MDSTAYKYIIIIFACALVGYLLLGEMPLVSGAAAGGALGALGVGYYLYRTDTLGRYIPK